MVQSKKFWIIQHIYLDLRAEFEKEFAKMHDVKYCLGTSSVQMEIILHYGA